MRREQRLRQRKDFATVRAKGRGPASALLGIRGVRTGNATSRVGFAVPKKVGTAVVRNRVRRRLRAIVGTSPLAAGWDIVIAVRPPAAAATFDTLAVALRDLLARGKMLDPRPSNLPAKPFPFPPSVAAHGSAPAQGSEEAFARGDQWGKGGLPRRQSAEVGVRSQQGGTAGGTKQRATPQQRPEQQSPPTPPFPPCRGGKGPEDRGPTR